MVLSEQDIQKYKTYLGDYEMTDEQKVEAIQALWGVVEGFVDLAWGMDSASLAIKAAMKDKEDAKSK